MSTAQEIVQAIQGASAVTFAGGYAVFLTKPRVLFEPAHVLMDVRNDSGRCTKFHGRYADGSQLHMTWHPSNGAQYKTFEG